MAGDGRLGIPTVADRIAQMVVKRYLEPEVEQAVSSRFLWVPAGEVGDGGRRSGARAVLAR